MKLYHLLLPLVLLLANCGGGSSGSNGSNPFPAPTGTSVFTLDLSILDSSCTAVTSTSFSAGDTLCIQGKLLENGNPANGQVVSFASALGTLSAASKLTNTNGIAEIMLTSDNSNLGAAALTASYSEMTTTQNFEFLTNTTVAAQPEILLSLVRNGQNVNRFKAGENAQLQARLLSANQSPLSNQIVEFTAAAGALSTTSALTSNGIAQVTLTATDADARAAIASVQTVIGGVTYSHSMNYEIQTSNADSENNLRFGHFATNGQFVENVLGVSSEEANGNVVISAGATLGLTAAIVDAQGNRVITPTPVTFTSNCVANSLATIDQQVTTINGVASSTFQDTRCAGSSGNKDQIVATVVSGNNTLTLTRELEIQAEDIGSIAFISAAPTNIVLSGTGGQNNQSVSTITFQVNGALGNPLSQQEVNFSLNINIGGLSLSPVKGLTNSQGQISTRVTAGNVPTAVRVSAETKGTANNTIRTQSDLLSVNTGLPDQNSFTFSATNPNPEAHSINNQEVTLNVRLADSFNNPVPNGTTVNFTTEGGTVDPTCTIQIGSCNVIWRSSAPRVNDRRVTVLATAIGHETLFDRNGNNTYEDSDGGPVSDPERISSGFGNQSYGQTGFGDMSEAWRDDDEDKVRDTAEIFIDYNNDGQFNGPDTLFNGPQCTSATKCGQGVNASLNVRKSLVLVMSGSSAEIDVLQGSTLRFSNYQNISDPNLSLSRGSTTVFTVRYSDTADQTMPSGTTVTVANTNGELSGTTTQTVGLTTQAGKRSLTFSLANNIPTDGTPATTTITINITAPSGRVSTQVFTVRLL